MEVCSLPFPSVDDNRAVFFMMKLARGKSECVAA